MPADEDELRVRIVGFLLASSRVMHDDLSVTKFDSARGPPAAALRAFSQDDPIRVREQKLCGTRREGALA